MEGARVSQPRAAGAVGSRPFQRLIMARTMPGPPLHGGQIIELIDHGDIDARRTRLTVAAVGTLAVVGVAGGRGQNAGIILFRLRGCFIRNSLIHMLRRIISARMEATAGLVRA